MMATEVFGNDLEAIYNVLKAQDVGVLRINKKIAKGQFELILKPEDAMKAVEHYFIAREVISQYFNQYYKKENLVASFLPKHTDEDTGAEAHAFFSLWKSGVNITGDEEGVTPEAENFMAGIQDNFSALVHFLSPSPLSLRKIQDKNQPIVYQYWGIENKTAPINIKSPLKPGDLHSSFELRLLDHTSNMYFAIASIIVLGIRGMKDKLLLPETCDRDAALLTENQRLKLRIQDLPNTFEDRKEAILGDEGAPLRAFFGDDLIKNILAVHEADFNFCKDLTMEDEVKHLVSRY